MITRAATALGLGALALGTVATTSTPAAACGGFFCSQVPIDQMGEDIIFGYGANGTVTAQILINYTGEAKDFAWILPVPSKPEISIGSNAAFQVIRGMTQPSWYLQWNYDNAGQCGGWFYYPEAAAGGVDDDGSNQGGVTVVESKDVGPFATVILESSSTEELVQWLNDNGYDQPAESTPLIDHYVQQGMMFVALKLKQNESSGSIQPIVLEMQEDDPCVPLVLTQIAATPDMPVRTYILGDHRVVPTNWMHVVLNEKKIDWLNYGQNYQDLVTQAVNEAAGHGFVTEYAGSSALLDGALYRDGQFDLARLAQITSPAAFVDELLRQGFPRDTTMQGLLRKYIPMPAEVAAQGVDERSFYNNLEGYDLSGIEFDPQGFVADLEERVITPLREAQDLFDASPYLTRLFTTVSPEEMDRDPDVFLMGDEKWFVAGLGSFLAGHVAYIVALQLAPTSAPGTVIGLVVVAVGIAVVGRRIVVGVASGDHQAMVVPVVAYLIVISAMVVSAFGTTAAWAIVGASLFYASDAILAWNRFLEPRRYGPLAVMVTYHLGQFGLVAWLV